MFDRGFGKQRINSPAKHTGYNRRCGFIYFDRMLKCNQQIADDENNDDRRFHIHRGREDEKFLIV